jgi:hypothetical protein
MSLAAHIVLALIEVFQILFALALCSIAFLVMFMVIVYRYQLKLREVPALRWLTLTEIVALRIPKWYCRLVLPHLKRVGRLEAREIEAITPDQERLVYEYGGLCKHTIELHEYQFKPHDGGAKRRRQLKPTSAKLIWKPSFQPSRI